MARRHQYINQVAEATSEYLFGPDDTSGHGLDKLKRDRVAFP